MSQLSTLAAVDLGSNSFRLEVARIVDDQLYPLDSLREAVRLGAGLTADKRLDEISQARALEALHRFGERLRGLPPEAVRAGILRPGLSVVVDVDTRRPPAPEKLAQR